MTDAFKELNNVAISIIKTGEQSIVIDEAVQKSIARSVEIKRDLPFDQNAEEIQTFTDEVAALKKDQQHAVRLSLKDITRCLQLLEMAMAESAFDATRLQLHKELSVLEYRVGELLKEEEE